MIAVGAAVVLIAIVAVVALTGGGGDDERRRRRPMRARLERIPPRWRSGATTTTRHGYEGALVTYLTDDAEEVDSAELGRCAVIFPAQALDSEPIAAGEALRAGTWTPIASLPGSS